MDIPVGTYCTLRNVVPRFSPNFFQATIIMTSLISLPPEILDRMCRFLERTEVYSIRLTCRTLASVSYDQFAKQEVSEVYLALTSDGLQSLEELTSLEALRTYVKVRCCLSRRL
jgi:hypothetical protein